jgi:predicted metalloprotease
MGPFYCPSDQKVYLDTSFFREIATKFGGCDAGSKTCEFAQAYVIAHEIGHHVQQLLGVLTRAHSAQQAAGDRTEANRIQVRVELQADCFAGVWAKHENDREVSQNKPPFIEPATETALPRRAIGDDTLQRRGQGQVVPDSFTHGSAEQRQRWFSNGLRGGTVAGCNTFGARCTFDLADLGVAAALAAATAAALANALLRRPQGAQQPGDVAAVCADHQGAARRQFSRDHCR